MKWQRLNLIKHAYYTPVDSHADKPYICNKYGKGFHMKNSYTTTSSTREAAQMLCCGEGFRKKTCLIQHQIFHSAKTSLICFTCCDSGKFALCKNGLISHQRIHMGEKPYECNKCEKAFTLRSRFNVHQRNIYIEERCS